MFQPTVDPIIARDIHCLMENIRLNLAGLSTTIPGYLDLVAYPKRVTAGGDGIGISESVSDSFIGIFSETGRLPDGLRCRIAIGLTGADCHFSPESQLILGEENQVLGNIEPESVGPLALTLIKQYQMTEV